MYFLISEYNKDRLTIILPTEGKSKYDSDIINFWRHKQLLGHYL